MQWLTARLGIFEWGYVLGHHSIYVFQTKVDVTITGEQRLSGFLPVTRRVLVAKVRNQSVIHLRICHIGEQVLL
jgi:hypothetical protein